MKLGGVGDAEMIIRDQQSHGKSSAGLGRHRHVTQTGGGRLDIRRQQNSCDEEGRHYFPKSLHGSLHFCFPGVLVIVRFLSACHDRRVDLLDKLHFLGIKRGSIHTKDIMKPKLRLRDRISGF